VTSSQIQFDFHDFADHPWRQGPDLPVQDVDLQEAIKRVMKANGWKPGLADLYFVFLGQGVQLCDQNTGECSADGEPDHRQDFCAYHSSFPFDPLHPDNPNTAVIYAAMPHVHAAPFRGIASLASKGRCGNVNFTARSEFTKSLQDRTLDDTTPNQLEADYTLVAVSHEFFESVTDPLPPTGWFGTKPNAYPGTPEDYPEVGDKCNAMVGSFAFTSTGPEGYNVKLNGNPYLVQEIWSNDHSSCVLGGPLVIIAIETGAEALKDSLSVNALLLSPSGTTIEGAPVKFPGPGLPGIGGLFQDDLGWVTGSIQERVFSGGDLGAVQQFALGTVYFLADLSLGSGDTWSINALHVKVLDDSGNAIPGCDQSANGTPLVKLTEPPGSSYSFPMPNCH
jgi:hypothetical protein